jgi:hypothetical protein
MGTIRTHVGLNMDGKKMPIVGDLYHSTEVTGRNVPVVSRTVPHTSLRPPKNQYGENRTIAGGKGKK